MYSKWNLIQLYVTHVTRRHALIQVSYKYFMFKYFIQRRHCSPEYNYETAKATLSWWYEIKYTLELRPDVVYIRPQSICFLV